MAGFAKRERQKIVDGYLNATGRNQFVPGEFLDWLKDHPENDAYKIFYSITDTNAARQYRIQQVRGWISGLRINVTVSETTHHIAGVKVGEYKTPAMISPTKNRKHGGGYQPVSDDPEIVAELRAQAAMALETWLDRFGGVLDMVGGDRAAMEQIVGLLSDVADAA